jgi:hypothetical protein
MTVLQELLGWPFGGNLMCTALTADGFGSRVQLQVTYQHDSTTHRALVTFEGVRNTQWIMQQTQIAAAAAAFLQHDLGAGEHQAAAHLATTLFEVWVSYQTLTAQAIT